MNPAVYVCTIRDDIIHCMCMYRVVLTGKNVVDLIVTELVSWY